MIPWKLNPLVVDISHYNLFDFGVAKGYVDLVICKCGELTPGRTEDKQYDITFATNIQKAKDNAIAAGAYIYLSPDYYIVNQLAGGLDSYRNMTRQANLEYTRLRTWIAGKEIYCLMFDLEKQWINAVPAQGRIPSNWVIANLDLMYTHVKQGQAAKEIPDVPLILYTSDSYSKAACIIANDNALYTWVAKHPDVQLMSATWIAPTVACYWSEVRKYLPADNLFPPYINSAKIPMFWQFSAAGGIKPGTDFVGGVLQYRETDLSCCSVSKDELYKWLKYNQVAPPPPPPEPPVPPIPPNPDYARLIAIEARLDKIEDWINRKL